MYFLTSYVKERIEFVAKYIGTQTNDWVEIKKHVVNSLANEYRVNFTRRNNTTLKHYPLNEYEKMVADYWKEITGVELVIPEEKLHPVEKKFEERGWGLKLFNQRRQKKK